MKAKTKKVLISYIDSNGYERKVKATEEELKVLTNCINFTIL